MTPKEIVKFVRKENPYQSDIFIEPTKEQFEEFNKYLKQCGLYPDAYNGSMGRQTWDNCCKEILRLLKDEENELGE